MGHPFGDFVLRRFARVPEKPIRETGIAARYGGEEFAVLLPAADSDGALGLAEKILANVENETFKSQGKSRRVTVSTGVASLRDHKPPMTSDLVGFADQALYHAKNSGWLNQFLPSIFACPLFSLRYVILVFHQKKGGAPFLYFGQQF